MKNILDMTIEERQIYIRKKAINKVMNKINYKYELLKEGRKI
jgi:hypothetical protein